MKNILYIIVGTVIILMAAFFSLFLYKKNIKQKPWVNGFIRNLFYSYQKYHYKSWLRRLVLLFKYPETLVKYIKILSNKQEIIGRCDYLVNPTTLMPQHDIVEDEHFKQRVEDYKDDKEVGSDFGDILVVEGTIHDGHHRVAAAIQANIKWIVVSHYFTKKQGINKL